MDAFSLVFTVFFLALLVGLSLFMLSSLKYREDSGRKRIQVVVLGDVGRSPRMQYHSLSLVQQEFTVDLIGYGGNKLIVMVELG